MPIRAGHTRAGRARWKNPVKALYERALTLGPQPRFLGCLGDLHNGRGSERVAGSVCLRSDFIELPDSPDPFASQDRQRKLIGQGAGAGHRPATPLRGSVSR